MFFLKNIFRSKHKQAEEIFSKMTQEALSIKRAELGGVEKYTEWLKRKLIELILFKEDRRIVGYPSIPNEWREKIELIVEELQKLNTWTEEINSNPVVKLRKK